MADAADLHLVGGVGGVKRQDSVLLAVNNAAQHAGVRSAVR